MKNEKTMKLKRKIRKLKKKISSPILSFLTKNLKFIIYISLTVLGLAMMLATLGFPEECDKVSNIICGVGSGIFASILVTLIINAENDAREKRKLQKEKEFIFKEIISASLEVYGDVIYRINEYITLSEFDINCVYGLCTDFKPYNDFEKYLKTLNINTLSEDEKKRIDKLFNFANYRIDSLISNLKHLPRQEYYLRGLLTEEEYISLVGNTANDAYLSYAEHIEDFWDDEVIDLSNCIKFLRMTTYITSRTIAAFDYATKKANNIETNIKEDMDRLYFDEIYCNSEEYIMSQINAENDKWEYYDKHPEALEELGAFYNLTEEDFTLDELCGCICGFSEHDAKDLLDKLDKNSEKVKALFNNPNIRKTLKKNYKIKSIIKSKYGKRYLKNVWKQGENNNG